MDTTDDIMRETAACRTCGRDFDAAVCMSPFSPGSVLARQLHCDRCVAAERERQAQGRAAAAREKAERDLEEAWARICPTAYRSRLEGGQTDVARIEALPWWPEISAHPIGPMGLILRGPTGAGKTRCMFRLLRAYHVQTPRPRIVAMTAGEFDRGARDAGGDFTLSKWFDRLAGADALFLDDVGKGKWTASTAGQFWELVDARTKDGKPLFITTNLSGRTLVDHLGLGPDIGEPLLRRLRESCKVVVMGEKKERQ